MNTRNTPPSRRQFLQNTALASAVLASSAVARSQEQSPVQPSQRSDRIRVACIGVGNKGYTALSASMENEQVVALCDVDSRTQGASLVRAADAGHPEILKLPRYKDYRVMFDEMADQFDAVTVCTPDHHHFPAAMLALQHGKHVFVEKPLTHSVAEARALKAAAREAGVVTQMGNQGHTTEGIRLIREWFESGLIGEVREVLSWASSLRPRYFYRPAQTPPPPGESFHNVDWDLWLGPAAERPYTPLYQPVIWRGWWDFGNSMLGDWACHTLDAPYWALQLGAPSRVEVEVSGTDPHIVPEWAIVTYHFPARGQLPPVKLSWHEGQEVRPQAPAIWDEADFPGHGMLMLGNESAIFHEGRPDSPRLVPQAAMARLREQRPEKWIPRVKGGPMAEWFAAIRGDGPAPGSSFDYAADLTQMALLGTVAMRAGKGFDWDDQQGRITSDDSLNRFIDPPVREGWRV